MTVSKAYGLLESEGLLERRRGLGMVVALRGRPAPPAQRLVLLEPALIEAARQVGQLGVAHDALHLFEKCLRRHESSPARQKSSKEQSLRPRNRCERLMGVAILFAVRRLLEPLVRLSKQQMLPIAARSSLRIYLERWTPLNASPGRYWWQSWYGVVSASLYAIWQGAGGFGPIASLSLPMRLYWLLLLGGICSSTLSLQGLHWRRWLRWLLPGAPLRNRIGTELFQSTAKMYLIVLPPLAVLSAAAAWWFGLSPHDIRIHAVHGLLTIAELVFAIAVADAWSAVFKGRMNKAKALLVVGLVLLASMSLAWLVYALKVWRPDSVDHSWPKAGVAYSLTLLVATPALVAAADILWRRRDLHDLIRRNVGAW